MSVFGPAKHQRLAGAISIKSPTDFRESITRVKKLSGFSPGIKKKALVLAQTRAKLQLRRTNLSPKERIQMRTIAFTRLPRKF